MATRIKKGMPADAVLAEKGAPWEDTGKPTEIVETDHGGRPQVVRWYYSDMTITLRYRQKMWRVHKVKEAGADDN
jgi:hypothetical protein